MLFQPVANIATIIVNDADDYNNLSNVNANSLLNFEHNFILNFGTGT